MLREFEIFSKPSLPSVAVKRGFSWPGFFFTWIWAFSRGLWVQGIIWLTIALSIGFSQRSMLAADPLLYLVPTLLLSLNFGVRGIAWRSRKLERAGYDFAG